MATTRYLFVHMQKTAGTALLRRLRHQFGSEAVYPTPDQQGSPEAVLDVELLRRNLSDPETAIRMVTGHFPLATAELLPGHFATFTVLRDPVDRVLSFLRHQRQVEPAYADMALEEIYDQPISTGPLVRDHMTRMLSLSPAEMTDGALTPVDIDDRRVETACQSLVERMDLFGIQERFDSFCADLEQAFGWDLGDTVFMNRTRSAPTSRALRERIARDNAADLEVYACAVRHLLDRRRG